MSESEQKARSIADAALKLVAEKREGFIATSCGIGLRAFDGIIPMDEIQHQVLHLRGGQSCSICTRISRY